MLEPAQVSRVDEILSYFNLRGTSQSCSSSSGFSAKVVDLFAIDANLSIEPLLLQIIFSLLLLVLIPYLITKFIYSSKESASTYSIPFPGQAKVGWKGETLDSPSIFNNKNPGFITCYDPATAYHITDIQADTKDSINDKVEKARLAQLDWKMTSWSQRRKVLNSLKKWVTDNTEQIARVAARDTGKTPIDAAFGELLTTLSKLSWVSGNGERILQPEVRKNNLLLAHKTCTVFHVPRGVVCACVSWNYPAHNLLGPIISSIFAGNAIILKSSELVAFSSSWIIQAARGALSACGHNPDLIQLVTCFPSEAEVLTTHPSISHITFIGSEEIGRKVAMAATKELCPVTLELGGKDPAIILKSADLKFFNSTFMRSCFQAAGQNCIGIERFIVSKEILDDFLKIVEPRIKGLKLGSAMDDTSFGQGFDRQFEGAQVDMGAMINDVRFDNLEGLIQDAVKRGARLLVGGKRFNHPKWTKGSYFTPTLITDVTSDMPIAQTELFAPIFLIMPFSDVDDALRIANSTRYGLGASVFGGNRSECEFVAQGINSGMVNINDFGVSYLNQGLPFGGVKASGYGRFAGSEGLLAMTTEKAVTQDRLFSIVKTGIPPPLDYPMLNPGKGWTFVHSLIHFAYGTVTQRVTGIVGLIRGSI